MLNPFLKKYILPVVLLLPTSLLRAQTDMDAIMMSKSNLCIGGSYMYSSWDHYWEGTYKRDNQNMGTVSTKMFGLMGTYGVNKKLNIIVGAPYVATHATKGTLHDQKGIQDLSVWVKWMFLEKNAGNGILSLYALGGGSVPLTNYIADYLPLAIGLQSKTLSGRLLADYQQGKFFATLSGTYTWRSNINVDEPSYYTTSMHNTNEVRMPNASLFNFRTGYRSDRMILEAVATRMTTLGGLDIRKNSMPFPSSKMNATVVGAHFKYNFPFAQGLSLEGGGEYTVAGRNVGQSTGFDIGVFYILNFSPKKKSK